eukprot:NODE_2363_length_949_cov_1380.309843.p4 GENE.NODE_2363_length_949_cov_1380.309843~~NODE_2363_length_949_cov_1380.309843.p4  ORF type:complete len:85 (-),score=27.85 NODE_2363_length_949_cov_1380.309843:567-821(-)
MPVFGAIERTFREMVRITQSGAIIAFTHREDLVGHDELLPGIQHLQDEGLWTQLFMSDAEPFLPHSPDPKAASMKVHYFVTRHL